MKRIWTCLLTFLSLFVIGLGNCRAQSLPITEATGAVPLTVNFHPGETLRYTFSLNMNLTNRVDPSIPSDKVISFTPRQYTVEGEIVATLAPAQPGKTLRGNVQLQGLTVKNWVSSASVAELEERLRVLESTSIALTTMADGNMALAEVSPRPTHDRYVLDVEDLESVAQALLVSRVSSQPLEPGQQVEAANFPIPGMVKPGIKLTVVTDYLADVPIARHRSAEVRLSMQVPNQAHPVSSTASSITTTERYFADGVWTYLLDLDARQISFLHKTIRTETAYSAESADSNDPIRIPRNLFTVDMQFEATARREAETASPQREADLAAFEKSLLVTPPPAAALESVAIPAASPGPGASLGDIARRYRAERAAQEPPPAEAPKPQEAAAPATPVPPERMTAGFKHESFSSGNMTVQIPSPATDINRTGDIVTIRYHLAIPTPLIVIVLAEINVGPGDTGEHAFDGVVQGLETAQGIKVLHSQTKQLNGMPGIILDALQQGEMTSRILESAVIVGGRMYVTSCGTLQTDFARVKPLCQTVIESPRPRDSGL